MRNPTHLGRLSPAKLAGALLVGVSLAAVAVPSMAQTDIDYGNFDGYTLRVKLIGGAQYEPLYALIPQWEEMTGATVDILSRANHFDLDREIKQDIAAGTLDWCVGSNHTSFAPQYGGIYRDLTDVHDVTPTTHAFGAFMQCVESIAWNTY